MEKFNKKLSKKLVQKSMSLMTMFVLLGALSVACSNTDKDGKGGGSSTVAVTGVSLADAVTYVGGKITLTPTITPPNASNQKVTWESDKPSVATIDTSGVVAGVKKGTTKITVTTEDGGKIATATITVNKYEAVTGVSLDKTSATIERTKSITLVANVTPNNASNKNVTWKSSDETVATVDNNGKVTGVDGGTATITVTTEDEGKTATADITVEVHVASVNISPNSNNEANPIMVAPGTSTYLTAVITPSNATNQEVIWEVVPSASGISVDANGKVSVGNGVALNTTATIKVTTKDGSQTAQASIKVVKASPEAMVAVPTNGSTTITFPMNDDADVGMSMDDGTGTIKHKFVMSQTEVTYELWYKVRVWATSNKGYNFSTTIKGREGSDGTYGAAPTAAKNEPVTTVFWNEAIVWSNAYTEWYNAVKGGSLSVVYKDSSGNILRDVWGKVEDNLGSTFDPTTNTATGFRLPTSAEWEFAARLTTDSTYVVANNTPSGATYPLSIGGSAIYYFTKGNAASGATTEYDDIKTGDFAWYEGNSCTDGTGCKYNGTGTKKSKTRDVASKKPNALGLYDMSGNVQEWCFDRKIKNGWLKRVLRGGEWFHNKFYLRVGYVDYSLSNLTSRDVGFRVVRTVP